LDIRVSIVSVIGPTGKENVMVGKLIDSLLFALILISACLGVYHARADNCARQDCKEINAYGKAVTGVGNVCSQICTDMTCSVTTSDCTLCQGSTPYWCLNADTTLKCCDAGATKYTRSCSDGVCTLTCPDHGSDSVQANSCSMTTGAATKGSRFICKTPIEGQCP
jgi:hypothetical protein